MPRRNSGSRTSRATGAPTAAAGEFSVGFGEREAEYQGQAYRVRAVNGSGRGGPYRCPGCDQMLAASSGHVVCWPADDLEADDRRHWHSACWSARDRRRPGVQRSRNAPRYS
jgi:hypothetical protein